MGDPATAALAGQVARITLDGVQGAIHKYKSYESVARSIYSGIESLEGALADDQKYRKENVEEYDNSSLENELGHDVKDATAIQTLRTTAEKTIPLNANRMTRAKHALIPGSGVAPDGPADIERRAVHIATERTRRRESHKERVGRREKKQEREERERRDEEHRMTIREIHGLYRDLLPVHAGPSYDSSQPSSTLPPGQGDGNAQTAYIGNEDPYQQPEPRSSLFADSRVGYDATVGMAYYHDYGQPQHDLAWPVMYTQNYGGTAPPVGDEGYETAGGETAGYKTPEESVFSDSISFSDSTSVMPGGTAASWNGSW
ncbi:hypothetical protein QBC47DRAFT_386904 [Echria macrotheca]|uniref:Uncharacterized protein n=1 Tax=Echria macrotheca TaxID=438768 RepID=A0AAJ0F4Q7_9PEZI|nr:hypothetical protein QBC47DRAFT_386904 [Echria macrotheca]